MNTFDNIILIFLLAVAVSAIFLRLRFPTIIGYIVVGIVVGPHAFGLILDLETTTRLAEFGIVFLLFTIGLEFSLTRLIMLRRMVFGCGSLQVSLSVLSTMAIGWLIGMTITETIIVGCVVAMSSTAIVIKQLTDQVELNTEYGANAVALLLFQDLAVIPILIFMLNLSGIESAPLLPALFWSLIKGLAAILIILSMGRWILRPLFYQIAETHSLELFTITALLITLGAAWLTDKFGLSMVLGAFGAGIMLGETEFRHRIETDIRPFKDVFLGLYFLSIGMLLNLNVVIDAWQWVLLLLTALIFFKILLITIIVYLFSRHARSSLVTGLVTGQGGEFGLAILTIAMTNNLIPKDYAQVILAAILLSMILAPIIIRKAHQIVNFLLYPRSELDVEQQNETIKMITKSFENHVILCGYGRIGQNIARFLEKAEISYLAIDLDPSIVSKAMLAGEPVCHADASHYEVLELAKVKVAKAVVVTVQGANLVKKIIEQIRVVNKTVPIIVKGFHEDEIEIFYELGATEVIPEAYETSLMFVSHILLLMGVKAVKVMQWIDESRQSKYDLLRMVFASETQFNFSQTERLQEGLQVVNLTPEAFATGRRIVNINLPDSVKVTAIRRRGERIVDPEADTVLHANDTIVLYGKHLDLEHAVKLLIEGTDI